MRRRKRRHSKAAFGETSHSGESAQCKLKILRADYLASDADIGEARFAAQCKGSRRAAPEQPFIGRESLRRPMCDPVRDRLGIGAERLSEMIADAGRRQRMSIGN